MHVMYRCGTYKAETPTNCEIWQCLYSTSSKHFFSSCWFSRTNWSKGYLSWGNGAQGQSRAGMSNLWITLLWVQDRVADVCACVCGGAIDDMLAVQSKANKVLFDTLTCFYVLATLCYSHLQFTLHYMYVHSYPAICHEKLPWKTAHSAWDTLGPTIGVTAMILNGLTTSFLTPTCIVM